MSRAKEDPKPKKAKRTDPTARLCRLFFLLGTLALIAIIVLSFLNNNVKDFFSNDVSTIGKVGFAILGTVIGLAFAAFFSLGILLLYLIVRQRNAKRKWSVEVTFITTVVLVNAVTKFGIILYSGIDLFNENSFGAAMASITKAFYDVVGGLQFEGLAEASTANLFLLSLYHGTSIITGLTFLGVISATFAYEFYSRIQLSILVHGFRTKELATNVYVFTDLNSETLYLANSIKEKKNKEIQDNEQEESKDIIIFAGPALEPFDRHNELCVEAMGNRFLYWSYFEQEGKSIAEMLHLSKKENQSSNSHKFYVFAFETDEKFLAKEENNSDTVFDDLKARIKIENGEKVRKDNLFVHYVLLGRGEINFQAYENRWKEISSALKQSESETPLGVLVPWAESMSIAGQVAKHLKSSPRPIDCVPNDTRTNALIIGFGQTSQYITKELYIHSAMLGLSTPKEQGGKKSGRAFKEAEFVAHVYDKDTAKSAGLFEMENPGIKCLPYSENAPINKPVYDEHGNLMPLFLFHKENFGDLGEPKKGNKFSVEGFDYVVIAVGTDKNGIRVANTIISDQLNQYYASGKKNTSKLTLFVTIYDKHNNHFLMRNSNDDTQGVAYEFENGLKVRIVGNRNFTFDYEKIDPQTQGTLYNDCYNVFNAIYCKKEEQLTLEERETKEGAAKAAEYVHDYLVGTRSNLDNDSDQALARCLRSIFDQAHKQKEQLAKNTFSEWSKETLWDRQSTLEATAFAPTYLGVLQKLQSDSKSAIEELVKAAEAQSRNDSKDGLQSPLTPGELTLLQLYRSKDALKIVSAMVEIEHIRWRRFHIAHGWKYCGIKGPDKKDGKNYRLHNCLLPAADLDASYLTYDFINASLALLASLEKRITVSVVNGEKTLAFNWKEQAKNEANPS